MPREASFSSIISDIIKEQALFSCRKCCDCRNVSMVRVAENAKIFKAFIIEISTQMCAHHESEGGYGNSPHMRTIAWSILVMGISIAIVILLYVWFGWEAGSNFSNGVMKEQQTTLR